MRVTIKLETADISASDLKIFAALAGLSAAAEPELVAEPEPKPVAPPKARASRAKPKTEPVAEPIKPEPVKPEPIKLELVAEPEPIKLELVAEPEPIKPELVAEPEPIKPEPAPVAEPESKPATADVERKRAIAIASKMIQTSPAERAKVKQALVAVGAEKVSALKSLRQIREFIAALTEEVDDGLV